jgi:hypothetical protein
MPYADDLTSGPLDIAGRRTNDIEREEMGRCSLDENEQMPEVQNKTWSWRRQEPGPATEGPSLDRILTEHRSPHKPDAMAYYYRYYFVLLVL